MANVNLVDSNDIKVLQNNSNISLNLVDRLDLHNDTSGANWRDMMKNKLDYCINNINTTKSDVETFINGGWSGVNYGFGLFSKLGTNYQLVWISSNATYYCRKLGNGNYDYKDMSVTDSGWIQISNNVTNDLYYRVVGKLYYLKGSFTGDKIGSDITLPFTSVNTLVWDCAGNANHYAKVYINANTNILGLGSHTGQSSTTYVINFAFYID